VQAAAAPPAFTTVSGTLTSDTTWIAANSPYIVDSTVTVSPGSTLTIEPGVVIKLSGANSLVVAGTLDARGTSDEPIYFTSLKDDVGGDANNDGTSSTPAASDWYGIEFRSGSVGTLEHAVVRYAGHRNSRKKTIPAVYNTGGTVTISNSIIADNNIYGIGQTAGSIDLSSSTVSNTDYGVVVLGGDAVISDSIFESALRSGVLSDGSGAITLTDNTFTNNNTAVNITVDEKDTVVHNDNSATGGRHNGIVLRGEIGIDLQLPGGTLPYIITSSGGLDSTGILTISRENNLTVSGTGALTVPAGAVFKFAGDNAELIVSGELNAIGTRELPIYFTSIHDDTAAGDTNSDDTGITPAAEDWKHIQFNPGSSATLAHAIIRYGGYWRFGGSFAGLYNTGGLLTISDSVISNHHSYGIRHTGGTTTVSNSALVNLPSQGIRNETTGLIDARNNWWGDPSGPFEPDTNPAGTGTAVSDNVLFTPWLTTDPTTTPPEPEGASSVLFLPGIQASRLYLDRGSDLPLRVWEPGSNFDVRQLEMTSAGESVKDIFTRDIIEEVFGVLDIYNKFVTFMDDLVTDETIADWDPFAYDWRYSVFDVVENGTQYLGERKNPISEIERLAAESFSDKVTLIAHSNGGLLAKAIMIELEERGQADLVDRVILVGSPQLGTPQAVGTILHGYGQQQAGGLIVEDETAREVIRNLPSAYGLLPSQSYFEVQVEPVITFQNVASTQAFRSTYGTLIDNEQELERFMVGSDDGRPEPEYIEDAGLANGAMLTEAFQYRRDKLDAWKAPEGVEVIELVGVGLETVLGFSYEEFTKRRCFLNLCSPDTFYKPVPNWTPYGDGTVVADSADGYSAEKTTLYVDFPRIDDELGFAVEHSNFLESMNVQKIITDTITGTTTENDFASTTRPEFTNNRLVIGTHSPVTLTVKDNEGRVVRRATTSEGYPIAEATIPGGAYHEIAGGIYTIIPKDIDFEVLIEGQAEGGMTLTVDELRGEEQTRAIKVPVAEISSTTLVQMTYTNETFSNLQVDENGDGEPEYELTPEGERIDPEPELTGYELLRAAIIELGLQTFQERFLLRLADKAERFSQHDRRLFQRLERRMLRLLRKVIRVYERDGVISAEQKETILSIIKTIKS
jgi:pimeloyl-ACP methyl ester carboxylesterase